MLIGVSLAHQRNNNPWYYNFLRPILTPTTVCTGNTTEVQYLTKVLTLINTLQGNATYNAIFQVQSANFLAYVKNFTNQALLYTNCPGFVTGLKAAKTADRTAARVRFQIAVDIYQRIRQIPRDITGSNGPNDMDSKESHEIYC